MTIKYISDHHTAEDPGGLIKEVLDMGDAFPGPAEDIMLAWVLRLEESQDPAAIAQKLLQDYDIAEGPLPGGACGRVVELLRETAAFGQDRLNRHLCKLKRRGGRESRVKK